jgi:hypothetical protein
VQASLCILLLRPQVSKRFQGGALRAPCSKEPLRQPGHSGHGCVSASHTEQEFFYRVLHARPQPMLCGRSRGSPAARRRRGDNPTVWERVGEAPGATKLAHPLHTAGRPALCCPVPFISSLSAPAPAIARASFFRTQSFRSGSNQHFNPKVRPGPKYAEADPEQNSEI